MCKIEHDPNSIAIRNRLQCLLNTSGRRCITISARLKSRLIVNQAGGVLENAGLSIDPHLGIPFIPGSGLKGVARAAARESKTEISKIMAVFGWSAGEHDLPEKARQESYAGSVAFLPAYPEDDGRIVADVLTCHYPEYYRNPEKTTIALDNEDPLPNFFPAIEEGAAFSFPLVLVADPARLETLMEVLNIPYGFDPLEQASLWLEKGICDHGLGAKTSAGYGWFVRDFDVERKKQEELRRIGEEARQKVEREAAAQETHLAEERRLAAMSPQERCRELILGYGDEQFAGFAKSLSEKSVDEQCAFLKLLFKEKKDRWKIWNKKKPDLAESIRKIAESIGEKLP
ncbi:MAG TPA: type III-B CRISPR module RAMP protein Cmr6 [Acidobacteriota bacterium]|nr:type III-B CRISPR module RAMP protein Cmr6 [Acidobacteriota bacterium]